MGDLARVCSSYRGTVFDSESEKIRDLTCEGDCVHVERCVIRKNLVGSKAELEKANARIENLEAELICATCRGYSSCRLNRETCPGFMLTKERLKKEMEAIVKETEDDKTDNS